MYDTNVCMYVCIYSLPDGAEAGLEEPSYMQQMRGTRTRFYIGRPMRYVCGGGGGFGCGGVYVYVYVLCYR
jgi:hypothetical protein